MYLVMIAATAALGGLLFGYDTGVISGALLFLRVAFHLSHLMQGVVTSIALAGAAGGAAVAGTLADRFGRRPILIATAAIFVAGALVSALSVNLPMLLAGRLLVGVGIGGASMLTPLYLAEIAPAARRGALVSFNQLAVTSGILISYLVGYALASSGAWRWMLGLGGVPGVVLGVGMLLLPETPRWLAGHGHMDETKAALRRLRGPKARSPRSASRWRSAAAACPPPPSPTGWPICWWRSPSSTWWMCWAVLGCSSLMRR